jgi:predicted amidophosphoribosyltransferase
MNLTNCPACNQAISREANKCPACGQPLRHWARGLYAVKLIVALIFVCLALWFLLSALKLHPW